MEKLKLFATELRNLRRELVNTYAIEEDMQVRLDLLALNIEKQTEKEIFIFSHGEYEDNYIYGVFDKYNLALEIAELKKENYSRIEIYKLNSMEDPETVYLYEDRIGVYNGKFKSKPRYEEL